MMGTFIHLPIQNYATYNTALFISNTFIDGYKKYSVIGSIILNKKMYEMPLFLSIKIISKREELTPDASAWRWMKVYKLYKELVFQ